MADGDLHDLRQKLTVIIPSYQRSDTLQRALRSVVRQDPPPAIIVVDDGSEPAISLPQEFQEVTLLRLATNRGGSAARNAGVRAAQTPWITFLDDDDELLPGACMALAGAIDRIAPNGRVADDPISLVSAIEVVDQNGDVRSLRKPETRERGEQYFLEPYTPGRTYLTKQTFVIPRELYLSIGGFDETLPSRIHSEFSLRLNARSKILAFDDVTYRLYRDARPRVSTRRSLRHKSFEFIWKKHEAAMRARPEGAVDWTLAHADRLIAEGEYRHAALAVRLAATLDLSRAAQYLLEKLRRKCSNFFRSISPSQP